MRHKPRGVFFVWLMFTSLPLGCSVSFISAFEYRWLERFPPNALVLLLVVLFHKCVCRGRRVLRIPRVCTVLTGKTLGTNAESAIR